jgi:DNA repair ATPase RecN
VAEPQRGPDFITRLSDRGEDVIGRISDLPGVTKFLESANQLKERTDEMQRKLRGLDALERRVDALEKKVDALSKGTTSKPTTRRTTAAKPKPKTPGSGGNA